MTCKRIINKGKKRENCMYVADAKNDNNNGYGHCLGVHQL
jgi:hypothetical protein